MPTVTTVTQVDGNTADPETGNAITNYKLYTALLFQTDINTLSATVLCNTLGGDLTWGKSEMGTYTAFGAGILPVERTICPPFGDQTNGVYLKVGYNSIGLFNITPTLDDVVTLRTYNDSFDFVELSSLMGDSHSLYIEIRVYPS